MLITVCLSVAFAPFLVRSDPQLQDLDRRLQPPVWTTGGAWSHPLGTDALGRDLLSRLLYGGRTSLLIGFLAVAIAGSLGLALGLIAGYLGGVADAVIMRLADVQLAIPFILLAIGLIAAIGPNVRNLVLVLGITGWVVYARVIRASVLSLRHREFVEAARASGAGLARILARHVLPNVLSLAIVVMSLELATMVFSEAALSFLGVGVPPAIPSWGTMLGDGRNYMLVAWWVVTWPGLALAITMLSANLFGDWLRDALDPRLQRS